jgi:hypothetical protein
MDIDGLFAACLILVFAVGPLGLLGLLAAAYGTDSRRDG